MSKSTELKVIDVEDFICKVAADIEEYETIMDQLLRRHFDKFLKKENDALRVENSLLKSAINGHKKILKNAFEKLEEA